MEEDVVYVLLLVALLALALAFVSQDFSPVVADLKALVRNLPYEGSYVRGGIFLLRRIMFHIWLGVGGDLVSSLRMVWAWRMFSVDTLLFGAARGGCGRGRA